MKTAIVIGAGWAGLSAAVELAEKGFQVTVLEQSGRLGGRASSFIDKNTGEPVDNGQHLFMGCYIHTIRFLQKIGSADRLKFQKNLNVKFVYLEGTVSSLNCWPLPAPFHLFSGLLRLGTLSLQEKLAMRKVYQALKRWKGNGSLKGITVDDWLIRCGQSERSRKHFWDLITIATLNEQPSLSEADSLAVVLKEAFFRDKEKSQIGISSVGLSDLCGPPAEKFLKERQGQILKNKLLAQIVVEDGRVKELQMRDGARLTADVIVCAVPFFVLRQLLGDRVWSDPFFNKIQNLESSPIFSISLWLDRPVMDEAFFGMIDTHVQWAFNKSKILNLSGTGAYLSLVISGAHQYLGVSDAELIELCLSEIRQCFPQSRDAKVKQFLIQREKNATLSPRVGYTAHRPSQKTPLPNFFLCGDWTDTGLPATIESAVQSGVQAVAHIQSSPIGGAA